MSQPARQGYSSWYARSLQHSTEGGFGKAFHFKSLPNLHIAAQVTNYKLSVKT